jgi:murein tripeptide amidase MpaA
MKFSENILSGKINDSLLQHLVICIIPVYNIDGSLNRGCCSRSNQNGPKEYGFRGNARNLDLNRDFIKCDSENAKII